MQTVTEGDVRIAIAGAQVSISAETVSRLWLADLMRRDVISPVVSAVMPPAIGSAWAGQGGIYAGLSIDDGKPCHLILAEVDDASELTWDAAKKWAAKVNTDGHQDFTLPNRHDGIVLFEKLKARFEERYYWMAPEVASGPAFAWYQSFDYGYQGWGHKGLKLRARAVRRLVIQ